MRPADSKCLRRHPTQPSVPYWIPDLPYALLKILVRIESLAPNQASAITPPNASAPSTKYRCRIGLALIQRRTTIYGAWVKSRCCLPPWLARIAEGLAAVDGGGNAHAATSTIRRSS